jgi:hypothetical protein
MIASLKYRLVFAGLLILAAPPLSRAGILFTEDFENPLGLSDGNWASTVYGFVTSNPSPGAGNPSATVLTFGFESSGGDLFSIYMPESPEMEISFDFYSTAPYGTGNQAWLGTDHQNTSPCGSGCDEQWLWNNGGGALYGTVPSLNTWTHVDFRFAPHDSGIVGPAGEIVLKLEAGPADYFDNFVVQGIPEPYSAVLLGCGLGLLAFAGLRGRSAL